jgi:hypothetical protein
MSDALRAKITELVADYRGRTYNYPSDGLEPETVALNNGKEDAFSEVADDLEAILKSIT